METSTQISIVTSILVKNERNHEIDLKTWKSRMKPWEIIKQLIGHK